MAYIEKDIHLTDEEIVSFWEHVNIGEKDECWLWKRKCKRYGQFQIKRDGKWIINRAHRIAWVLTNGQIPKGLKVCHTCDVPQCCNPSHYFLGTSKDNVQDMLRKGRHQYGEDHHCATLSDADIRTMFEMRKAGSSHREIAERFNLNSGSIAYVLNGKRRQDVTLGLIKEFNLPKFTVRRCNALLTYDEAEQIRRGFKNGIDKKTLAEVWKMSEQMIYKIVSRQCYATSQF